MMTVIFMKGYSNGLLDLRYQVSCVKDYPQYGYLDAGYKYDSKKSYESLTTITGKKWKVREETDGKTVKSIVAYGSSNEVTINYIKPAFKTTLKTYEKRMVLSKYKADLYINLILEKKYIRKGNYLLMQSSEYTPTWFKKELLLSLGISEYKYKLNYKILHGVSIADAERLYSKRSSTITQIIYVYVYTPQYINGKKVISKSSIAELSRF